MASFRLSSTCCWGGWHPGWGSSGVSWHCCKVAVLKHAQSAPGLFSARDRLLSGPPRGSGVNKENFGHRCTDMGKRLFSNYYPPSPHCIPSVKLAVDFCFASWVEIGNSPLLPLHWKYKKKYFHISYLCWQLSWKRLCLKGICKWTEVGLTSKYTVWQMEALGSSHEPPHDCKYPK